MGSLVGGALIPSGEALIDIHHVKRWIPKLGLAAVAVVCLIGCATGGSGSAPGAVTGKAQSEPRVDRKQGEFYQTETLTPGIGSALFPDPAWR